MGEGAEASEFLSLTGEDMKIGQIVGIIVLIGLVLFALIQLVPYGRSHKNPSVVQEPNWDAQTRAIAKKACFDCHSNETL